MRANKPKPGKRDEDHPNSRRGFLWQMGIGGLAAAGATCLSGTSPSDAPAAEPSPSEKASPLPTITIGGKTITRLVTGSNPLTGASQATLNLSRLMNDYYTPERIADLLVRCDKVGINTFQSSYADKIRDGLRMARERGANLQWICLTTDGDGDREQVLALKPIALVHHGGVTDRFFREGKSDQIHDFIKKAHDQGVLAGVSSHVPNNVRAVEEKDWGNDFFMTCFYNVVRTKEDLKRQLGDAPVDYMAYMSNDPIVMTDVIRKSRKPCLAYKILAAGRLCWTPQAVEEAFRFAFSNIKPTDGVIVGMFPRFADEPSENTALTRKHGRNT